MQNYWANTNAGFFDIGTFASYQDAYRWGAMRYGNDFLGVTATDPTAAPPSTLTSWVPLLIVGALVWFGLRK